MPRPRAVQRIVAPVSGRTRIVGIFGDPVEHSRSPAIHNAAFASLGLDWVYLPFRVRAAEVGNAVRSIRALGMAGVNVTVPHKEAVLPFLDSLSPQAELVGAVNTIVNREEQLHGENTDVVGFLRALGSAGIRVRHRTVLVVGAGGAARGALVALAAAGAGRIWLANRTLPKAKRVARQLSAPQTTIEAIPLAALIEERFLEGTALVVNTTSVGWRGDPFPPLGYGRTPRHCAFFDMVYGRKTDFLRRAERAARQAIDGSEMLLRQGAASFTLWTRRRAPLATMRSALYPPRETKSSN